MGVLALPTARFAVRPPTPLLAFLVYAIASLLLFGQPLIAHLGSDCMCIGNTHDEALAAWGLAWWPHALLHGLNPFFPRTIYAPEGIDIAHGTLMPGPAFVLWPVTAIAGPLFSYNLAALLAPVLAAFFAFLLCRRLAAGAFWPALLGGWVFGFSTYMLGQSTGHLNLTLVFLIPALVHLGLRGLAGELGPRRLAGLLTVCLVGQFSISDEVFATFTVFAVIALVLGALLGGPDGRLAIRRLLGSLAVAYLATLVIVSPYLYYALKPGGVPIQQSALLNTSNDLLSFIVPTQVTRLGGLHFLKTTAKFAAGFVEGGGYLGLPLTALTLLGLWGARRRRDLRMLGAMLAVVLVCSLGPRLHVDGSLGIRMPWSLVSHLPLLAVALPSRFVMYATLLVGMIVASALGRAPAEWPRPAVVASWLLAVAAVVFLWPATQLPFWHSRPDVPRLFTTAAGQRLIGSRGNVLVLPTGIYGSGMLWQAESGFSFTMAGGYVVPPQAPDPYKSWPIDVTLTYNAVGPDTELQAESFLVAHHITEAILSLQGIRISPWPKILAGLGWRSRAVDGALILRAAPRALSCGRSRPGRPCRGGSS
jgi:hypothetical protein